MTKKELSAAHLEDLYYRVKADPKLIKSLDVDSVTSLLSFIKKLGLKAKAEQYACISWINWQEEAMQRAYLLAANGYISRSIREYELDGADAAEVATLRKFFSDKLGFNADKHVTEGIAPTETKDSIRRELGFAVAEGPCETVNLIAARDAIRSAKNTLKVAVESTSTLEKLIRSIAETISRLPAQLQKSTITAVDELSVQLKLAEQKGAVITRRLDELAQSEARLSCAITQDVTADLLNVIPPQDNVHGFNRYCADNWGSIKEITRRVYEVPGYLDATIYFHGATRTAEEADKFLMRIRSQLPYGAAIIADNGPTLIAPDLENEQMKMKYIDQGDVFTKILDRAEQDQKIVEKITGKKTRDSRKKIIVDEFKKNPRKLSEVRQQRKAGKKVDASGLNAYAADATGWVNGYKGPSVSLDDEQEIIDEVLGTMEDDTIYGYADGVAPIGIMGMNAAGEFEKIDVALDIPEEYAIEDTLAKMNKK